MIDYGLFFKRYFKPSGFTLIELLVVIGIIAILSTIGTVTYSKVRSRARDAKRMQDLDSISRALYVAQSANVDGEFPGKDYSSAESYGSCSSPPCSTSQNQWNSLMNELGVSGGMLPPEGGVYCLYMNSRNYDRFLLTAHHFEGSLPDTHSHFTERIGKAVDPDGSGSCGNKYKFIGGINSQGQGVAYDNGFYSGHCPGPCWNICNSSPITTSDSQTVLSYCVLGEL